MLLFRIILFVTMLAIILTLAVLYARKAMRKYREADSLVHESRISEPDRLSLWWSLDPLVWLGGMGVFCFVKGLIWWGVLLVTVGLVLFGASVARRRQRRTGG